MLFFTLLCYILTLYNQVLTTGESYIRIKHTLNNSSVPLTNNDEWITLRIYTGQDTILEQKQICAAILTG